MQNTSRKVPRRSHWRWQGCGPGRREMRRVRVRGTLVALPDPTPAGDPRQLDMLDGGRRRAGSHATRVRPSAPRFDDGPAVLRSYWRRQPCGPGGSLRKLVLVDVHAPAAI